MFYSSNFSFLAERLDYKHRDHNALLTSLSWPKPKLPEIWPWVLHIKWLTPVPLTGVELLSLKSTFFVCVWYIYMKKTFYSYDFSCMCQSFSCLGQANPPAAGLLPQLLGTNAAKPLCIKHIYRPLAALTSSHAQRLLQAQGSPSQIAWLCQSSAGAGMVSGGNELAPSNHGVS